MAFGPLDPKFDLPAIERRVLARWRELDVQERARELRAGAEPWIFYEGPPTANGRPGLHHVWARAFKDLYPRFRTMAGYQVPRKGGWDCHGLPVELAIEAELGLHSKQEIESYGIAEFNDRCRASVQRYVGDWTALTERAGVWIDTEDAYWTLNNDYIESVWWLISRLWEQDLLYEGHRVSPYCARCGTALSSHELGQPDVYRDVIDPSVYVRFPIEETPGTPEGLDGADLLIWTTTPWTLISNVAAAVGGELDYVRVPAEVMGAEGRDLIMAESRLPVDEDGNTPEVLGRWSGSELAGVRYSRPFDMLSPEPGWEAQPWQVVVGDFVSTDDGSGIVHLAPAFGEDDSRVARETGLGVLNPVGPDGTFGPEVGPWAGVFVKDADEGICEDLRARGLLVRAEPYEHSYPHCWRCSTPLIYWAKTSWFVRTSQRRDLLVDQNEEIGWHPDFIKHGRFGRWLESNVDWALSRDRYWGTPLPIWRCGDCGTDTCVGSVAELSELAGRDLADLDLHRPHIDEVTVACSGCGGTARRLAPVLDAWFDSGAMPSAQHHYPFADPGAERPDQFPADFICEAIDQTRGWFYSLLAVNALVFGSTPYRNVVCLALVVDEHGYKMSKSRGNVMDPGDIFEAHGADALRWYFFSQGQPWTTRRVFHDGIREAASRTLLTLWNVHSFFCTYADLDSWEPGTSGDPDGDGEVSHALDRWILSELDDTIATVTESLENFDALAGAGRLAQLIDDLSNWYVRRSRPRFWRSSDPAAHATLHRVLVTISRLLAPFCPFLAEDIHSTLTGQDSVHLTDWPEPGGWRDQELAAQMDAARRLVALGRSARTEAKVKVRQPLRRALVLHDGPPLSQEAAAEVRGELNVGDLEQIDTLSGLMSWQVSPNFRTLGPRLGPKVNQVKEALAAADGTAVKADLDSQGWVEIAGERLEDGDLQVRAINHEAFALAEDGGWAVGLDLELDDELRAEGTVREVVRALNEARKTAGFDISDRVHVRMAAPDEIASAVGGRSDWVAGEVLATQLELGATGGGAMELEIDGQPVSVELLPAGEQA